MGINEGATGVIWDYNGKQIDFSCSGLPLWVSAYQGRMVFDESKEKLYVGGASYWIDVSASGLLAVPPSGHTHDHGIFVGLADDDHTQYHTNARGDARYYTQTQIDTLSGYIGDHGNLQGLGDDDHSQYHTDGRGDARYYTQAQVTNISGAIQSEIASASGALDTEFTNASGALRADIDSSGVTDATLYAASGTLRTDITANTTAITGASGVLRTDITANTTALAGASGVLRTAITANTTALAGASGALRTDITANTNASGALRTDITANTTEMRAISGTLTSEIDSDIATVSGTLSTEINTDVAAVSGTLSTEINTDVAALSGTLDTSIANASGAAVTEASGIAASLDTDVTTAYTAAIATVSGTLSTEINTDVAAASGAAVATASGIAASLDTDVTTAYTAAIATVSGTLSSEINSDVAALSGTVDTNIANASGAAVISASGIADVLYLKKDGSTPLSSDWDSEKIIQASGIHATDASGMQVFSSGGNGLTVGNIGHVTFDKYIGVGIKLPDEEIHAHNATGDAAIKVSSATDNADIILDAPANEFAVLRWRTDGVYSWQIRRSAFTDFLEILSSGMAAGEGTVFTNDGVGIASNSPSTLLEVNDLVTCSGVIAKSAAGLKLYEDGGKGIFVEDGGQVGIGTAAPTEIFHIVGSSSDFLIDDNGFVMSMTRAGTCYIRASNADGEFKFETGGSNTRLQIDKTGGIHMAAMKSGTDQANAGAAAGELYFDTNDDNTVKMGV